MRVFSLLASFVLPLALLLRGVPFYLLLRLRRCRRESTRRWRWLVVVVVFSYRNGSFFPSSRPEQQEAEAVTSGFSFFSENIIRRKQRGRCEGTVAKDQATIGSRFVGRIFQECYPRPPKFSSGRKCVVGTRYGTIAKNDRTTHERQQRHYETSVVRELILRG